MSYGTSSSTPTPVASTPSSGGLPSSSSSSSTTGTSTPAKSGLTSDQKVNKVFDQYFTASQNFPSNEVDAVVGFFEKRGFDKTAAISTATTLLLQAKLDGVKIFELLDTLKGLDGIQLSTVVAQVINYNRPSTSTIGFRRDEQTKLTEKRNILV